MTGQHIPMTCRHMEFAAEVRVARLEDTGRFNAEIRIRCADCGTPFEFQGLAPGVDLDGARVSIDGQEAQFADDRGSGVEAGIFEMLDRMQTNRLKVFSNLHDWRDEFDLYHRKDGVLVKERDDLISATRYGMMMLRHAKAAPQHRDRYDAPGARRPRGSHMAA